MIISFERLDEQTQQMVLDMAFPLEEPAQPGVTSPALLLEIFVRHIKDREKPELIGKTLKTPPPLWKEGMPKELSPLTIRRLFRKAQTCVNIVIELLTEGIEFVPLPTPHTAIERVYSDAGFGLPLSEAQTTLDLQWLMDSVFSEKGLTSQQIVSRKREKDFYVEIVIKGKSWRTLWENECESTVSQALTKARERVEEILKALDVPFAEQRLHGSSSEETLLKRLSPEARGILIKKVLFPTGDRQQSTTKERYKEKLLAAFYAQADSLGRDIRLEKAMRCSNYRDKPIAKVDLADGMHRLAHALKKKDPLPTRVYN